MTWLATNSNIMASKTWLIPKMEWGDSITQTAHDERAVSACFKDNTDLGEGNGFLCQNSDTASKNKSKWPLQSGAQRGSDGWRMCGC